MKRIGLVAGGRALPFCVAEWARGRGIPLSIVGISGAVDGNLKRMVSAGDYLECRISEVSRAARFFRSRGADTIVLAGSVYGAKPSLTWSLVKILAKLAFMKSRYDGALRLVMAEFEKAGMKIAGIAEIMPELLIGKGVMGSVMPSARDMEEIRRAWPPALEFARTDKGQSSVAFGGRLIAVEDFKGTDALIARAAELKKGRRGGVLLKVLKPQQDRRADIPVIGLDTIRNLARGKFDGMAVEAGRVIAEGDRREIIRLADRHNIFIIGI